MKSAIGFSLIALLPGSLLISSNTENSTSPHDIFSDILTDLPHSLPVLLLLAALACFLLFQKRKKAVRGRDPLTEGMELTSFTLRLASMAKNSPQGIVLVLMDINDFKSINEAYGIEAANTLLRHIHDALKERISEGLELLCRSPADKFFMLLQFESHAEKKEDLVRARLETLLEAAQNCLAQNHIKHEQGFAVGACFIDDPSTPPYQMIDKANLAHMCCKAGPRRGVLFYDDAMAKKHRDQDHILNAFPSSLARSEFKVYLQPKISVRDCRVAGAEALVRWQHPELGMISPADFLPTLEDWRLIDRLDNFVFRETCRIMAQWREEGLAPLPISVNISRATLQSPHVIENYLAIAAESGIDPHWLELEVTESLFLNEDPIIVESIKKIRASGMRCAIDDFGSGYSSLGLLNSLRVDTLKIDGGFFRSRELSTRSRTICQSIFQMASELGISCVAEGVEFQDQVKFLRGTPCDQIQGWIYSKALTPEGFKAFAFESSGLRQISSEE